MFLTNKYLLVDVTQFTPYMLLSIVALLNCYIVAQCIKKQENHLTMN